MNLAVLFGGCSTEYAVSLQSAHAVITHLDPEKYTPVLIGITRDGRWLHYTGDVSAVAGDTWHEDAGGCAPALLSPDRGCHVLYTFRDGVRSETAIDAVFPVLHGKNGEDGSIQGLLELAGYPIVGCGTMASALCMDKDRAHRLVAAAGIAVPAAVALTEMPDRDALAAGTAHLRYPLFVKPVRSGSSIGITRVTGPDELPAAVEAAFSHDDVVLIEEGIPGFEVGCAVMGNRALTIGEVDEIELSDGFFDFAEKYTLKTSAIHMPARIDGAAAARIKAAAGEIYRVLGCSVFARVDMFLTPEGEIVFNEVNTIPGFTAHSRFPNMMKGIGLDFSALLDRLIALGLENAGA